MYPTVKAHRTAHWLWVQSWQDHIFRVTSFTKQQCKHFFFLEPDRDNIIKNIPLSWLVHKRLSQEYLISPQTGSESDLFHRWRVILAWLPAVDQWELCQAFKSSVFVWMLLKIGTGSADRRTEYGERERWAANVQQGTGNGEPGMTVFYSDPFSVLLSALLNCYADYRCTFGPSSCSWFPVPRSWF